MEKEGQVWNRNGSRQVWKNRVAWGVLGILLVLTLIFTYNSFNAPTKSEKERITSKASQKQKEKGSTSKSTSPFSGTTKFIGKLEVKISGLNLREAPEKGNNVVMILKKGETLKVISRVDNWYEVMTSKGERGYVTSHLRYVEVLEMNE